MSTPLALTVVWLFMKRGCASATMNSAKANQRNAAKNAPACECRICVNPSTSFTDEYKNAGGEPRRPFNQASNGSRNSRNKKLGCAKIISILAHKFWLLD